MDELTKLKADAYDAIVQIEAWQKELAEINANIQKLQANDKSTN